MRKILLIDHLPHNNQRFRSLLENDGLKIVSCESGEQAAPIIEKGDGKFAAVIILMEIPGPPFATELLQRCRRSMLDSPVVVVSSAFSTEVAARAYRFGAKDFLEMPLDSERVISCVRDLIDPDDTSLPGYEELKSSILGKSPALLAMLRETAKVIPRPDLKVLIIGEPGTGKELIAQAIHYLGPNKSAPFIAINVNALSPALIENELFGHEKGAFTGADKPHIGYFEQAGQGTLFLDEIGDLDLPLQVKLLRVIQERTFQRLNGKENKSFKARLICATNRDLISAVKKGTFRRDLYDRIAGVTIQVPPLRERKGDLDLLINHFIRQHEGGQQVQLARETMTILRDYTFPGNIRELKNLINSALIACSGGRMLPTHLPMGDISAFLPSEQTAIADDIAPPDGGVKNGDNHTFGVSTPKDQAYQHLIQELAQLLPDNWLYLKYKEAMDICECAFDRIYLPRLLERCHHKISRAAKAADIDRKTFKRHWENAGLPPLSEEDENNAE